MPNLIEVQRESYEQFLRSNPAIGYVSGLEKTLRSVFPIRDFAGSAELDFVQYELEEPKYDTEECRQRGITYAAPMRVTLRLIVFEVDADTETRSVLDIKEQDVYMGDMPLMTANGTFIINGTERVIVSQMHRSPGVLFDHDRGKTHASGKYLFAARVIPYRGSWLDFEFDAKDIVNVRIDRKRKLPVTALLYSLGLDAEDILGYFYNTVTWDRAKDGWKIPFVAEQWRNAKPTFALVDAATGEEVFPAGQKISPRAANKAAKDGLTELLLPTEEVVSRATVRFGRTASIDIVDGKVTAVYDGQTFLMRLDPQKGVEPEGALPSWATQKRPGEKIQLAFGMTGWAEVDVEKLSIHNRFPGWANFIFDTNSPFFDKSFGEVMSLITTGDRIDPARSNLALAWENILYNSEWQHLDVWTKLLQTIVMAFVGTLFATIIAFPLCFLAARNIK